MDKSADNIFSKFIFSFSYKVSTSTITVKSLKIVVVGKDENCNINLATKKSAFIIIKHIFFFYLKFYFTRRVRGTIDTLINDENLNFIIFFVWRKKNKSNCALNQSVFFIKILRRTTQLPNKKKLNDEKTLAACTKELT